MTRKTLVEMYEPIAKLVLISSLDMTWKDHLLSMDYLRESVSLRGYAQQNPLNEYKRRDMKCLRTCWTILTMKHFEDF